MHSDAVTAGGSAATTRRWSRGSRSPPPGACRCRCERYFQPSSQTMKTTLPSSISPAMRTAMRRDRAGRDAGEHALLVEQLARPDDRVAVGDEDLAVQQREVDDRRDEAVVERAQALDRLALHRLGRDDLDAVAELLLEAPAVAHQRAARAQAGDERVDLAVELLEDLERRAVVVRERVGLVAVLVGHVVRRRRPRPSPAPSRRRRWSPGRPGE